MSGHPPLPAPRDLPYRIGLVCLGNICRSPTAEVILTAFVAEAALADRVEVTSCGTGDWHLGEPMDPRAAAQLSAHGYDATAHRAQQFEPSWLELDLVLAMDAKNLAEITEGRGVDEHVRMFRSFDPQLRGPGGSTDAKELDTPDPWFGEEDGFVEVMTIVERTCRALVEELRTLLR